MLDMQISKKGLDFIKSHEGCFTFVYDDLVYPTREYQGGAVKGTLTIGIGHTAMGKHPLKPVKGVRITEEEALDIFDVDLDYYEDQVNRQVKVPLTQGQFDALVSFCYNCGPGNLAKLIVPLNKGDYEGTRAKFPLYRLSKGKVMQGLVRRREGEVALWDSKPEVALDVPTDAALPSKVEPVKSTQKKEEKKMFPFSNIAKAVIGALVTGAAAWAGATFGLDVPGDVQNWVTDTIAVIVAGLFGGAMVWAIPNTKTKTSKK